MRLHLCVKICSLCFLSAVHPLKVGCAHAPLIFTGQMCIRDRCSKSLVVVPNHLTEQWGAEWLQLYPGANILVATKVDFETANRKKFCGRIATGDYDAVIIGHSQLEKIPLSAERQAAMLQRQIDEITTQLGLMDRDTPRFTVKQMERTRKGLETRLERLLSLIHILRQQAEETAMELIYDS